MTAQHQGAAKPAPLLLLEGPVVQVVPSLDQI
jgi:hypothetical protein